MSSDQPAGRANERTRCLECRVRWTSGTWQYKQEPYKQPFFGYFCCYQCKDAWMARDEDEQIGIVFGGIEAYVKLLAKVESGEVVHETNGTGWLPQWTEATGSKAYVETPYGQKKAPHVLINRWEAES